MGDTTGFVKVSLKNYDNKLIAIFCYNSGEYTRSWTGVILPE